MTNRQTARVAEAPATQSYQAPATVVRFPLVLSVLRSGTERRAPRPSLALNIVLFVLLVVACVAWETMSTHNDAAQDVRHTPITSSRASLDDGARGVA
jgi:hypothetical protein